MIQKPDLRALALPNRRLFLGTFAAAFLTTPGLFAEQLLRTPELTEGPFYPDKLPLDVDNDLIIINDRTTPAIGEITHLTGRVLNAQGDPLSNITVEIWQCDGNGQIAGCFEDCCSCTGDPEDPDECCAPRRCSVCKGKGGWIAPPRRSRDE